jgi:hypothetical protein
MPVVFIEGPPGIPLDARKRMVAKIHAAVEDAYAMGDTLIFLREYSRENVAINGVLHAATRPGATTPKKIRSTRGNASAVFP